MVGSYELIFRKCLYIFYMRSEMQHLNISSRSLGLRSRFRIGTAVILLFSCILSALLIYYRERALLEERAYANTELVMAAVEASREYVREELRPKMYDVFGPNFFMLEAMSSSYVGRAVMDRFSRHVPNFKYRRVAINARNPDSEANSLEKKMIAYFKEMPDLKNWQGLAVVQNEAWYMRFEPVFFETGCLHCHGDPDDAPADLILAYGDKRGFGHYVGDMAGIIAVGVPVHSALAAIKDRATRVFIAVLLIVSIFYLFLMFFFDRIVIHNLRGLLDTFKHEIEGEPSEATDNHIGSANMPNLMSSDDELQALTHAGIALARNLRNARQELRRYALFLENEVKRRTLALQESQRLLQEKILTRDQELSTMTRMAELTTQTQDLQHIWRSVLNEILSLIPAQGAGVYIWNESHNALELVCREKADLLPERVQRSGNDASQENVEGIQLSILRAFDGNISSYESSDAPCYLNVPIACRGSQYGVFSFEESSGSPITDEQQSLLLSIGRQVGIAMVSLADRQRLLQSKELLQSVFDGITDMVMLLDQEYRIKMVNRAYLKRYNVNLEDVYDHPCYEVHSGIMHPCSDCGMKKAAETRQAVGKEIHCANGSIFLIQFYPVFDEFGNLESIIRYAREITDQKRMEIKIQQTEKMVAIGQLAAGVAHEINNPLGVILCYVDLLKRELSDYPQGLKDLAIIEKQALASRQIVTDLLQFARTSYSTRHPTAINTLIQDVAQLMKHQFKKDKIFLILKLDDSVPNLLLDADKIKQVLINLLINACQAIPDKGTVTVTSRVIPEDRHVEIQVHDTGIGIHPSIKTKIFDPFFTTKVSGNSTGLGLSVSYGIIQDHGGEITVESEPGRWTCFTVRLPINGSQ